MEFSKIYDDYGEKVYRLCLGFVNDPGKAKDLTQETFIAVWQNLDSLRNESAVGTWIYRIASNKCLRSIKNEPKKTELPATLLADEEYTEDQENKKLAFLHKCIAGLPEIERIIITLYMEDVPQEKIGEITGLTHINVRVRVHRIKDRILKIFNENGKL